jgi:hypothetical protein
MIKTYVAPHFGEHRKVADITFADIDALHRRITKAGHPYRSNRVVSLLSKMFALSVKWGMRETNPCRGIERNTEHNRERYLSADELARLTKVLAEFPDKDVAEAGEHEQDEKGKRGRVVRTGANAAGRAHGPQRRR